MSHDRRYIEDLIGRMRDSGKSTEQVTREVMAALNQPMDESVDEDRAAGLLHIRALAMTALREFLRR